MADVAFLLLLFFLVAATIDVDSGLRMNLPPSGNDPPPIAERNLLTVLLAQDGTVLIDGREATLEAVRGDVIRHLTNEGASPDYADNPLVAIVSFKTGRGVRYGQYVAGLDAILLGYRAVHDRVAQREFGAADYAAYRAGLAPGRPDDISARYPVKLSLAEPQ